MQAKKVLGSLIIIVLWLSVIISFAKIYLADIYFGYSENLLADGENIEALLAVNKAIKYNNQEPSYYRQRAKVYVASTANALQGSKELEDLKQLALQDLITGHEINPKNLATIRNSTPLYFYLANKDLSLTATKENLDPEYSEITKEYLIQMQNYLPSDVGVQVLAAKYQKRMNFENDLKESRERIKELRPDLLEWHPDLL